MAVFSITPAGPGHRPHDPSLRTVPDPHYNPPASHSQLQSVICEAKGDSRLPFAAVFLKKERKTDAHMLFTCKQHMRMKWYARTTGMHEVAAAGGRSPDASIGRIVEARSAEQSAGVILHCNQIFDIDSSMENQLNSSI